MEEAKNTAEIYSALPEQCNKTPNLVFQICIYRTVHFCVNMTNSILLYFSSFTETVWHFCFLMFNISWNIFKESPSYYLKPILNTQGTRSFFSNILHILKQSDLLLFYLPLPLPSSSDFSGKTKVTDVQQQDIPDLTLLFQDDQVPRALQMQFHEEHIAMLLVL